MSKSTSTIAYFEGFRAKPYWDVNHWRVGYGSDTWTDDNGKVHKVTKKTRVTREQANIDLQRRVDLQEAKLKALAGDKWDSLNEGTRAALHSIYYNYGGFSDLPSLRSAVRSGDPKKISAAIKARADDNNGINKSRRAAEADLAVDPTFDKAKNSVTALGAIMDAIGGSGSTGSDVATAFADSGAGTGGQPTPWVNKDYLSTQVQHGNNATADQLDNPGPVTSPDGDPFMNALALGLHVASQTPPTPRSRPFSLFRTGIEAARSPTHVELPDLSSGIRVTTVNPDGTDVATGKDALRGEKPARTFTRDPNASTTMFPNVMETRGEQQQQRQRASQDSSKPAREQKQPFTGGNEPFTDPTQIAADKAYGWLKANFGSTPGVGPGTDQRDPSGHRSPSTVSGAQKTRTVYVQPGGGTRDASMAGDAQMTGSPSIPRVPEPKTGGLPPDERGRTIRDPALKPKSSGIASLGLSIAGGTDLTIQTLAADQGLVPPLPAPAPLVAPITSDAGTTRRVKVKPRVHTTSMPQVDTSYTPPPPKLSGHEQLMKQQSSDQRGQAAMREAGMIDNFGMIKF
jgi:GH24 family phage-related lysozyme (muramidase)